MAGQLKTYGLAMVLSLFTQVAYSGVYVGLSGTFTQMFVEDERFSPAGAEVSLGWAIDDQHSVELSFLSGLRDSTFNHMTIEIPSVATATYRYNLYPCSKFKTYLVMGASKVAVKSTYGTDSVVSAEVDENYDGFVYGIAFEEALDSIPELKVTAQWVNLYDGDVVNMRGASLGMRYDF